MNDVSKQLITFFVCATIIFTSAIFSILQYNINERNLVAKNIELAINKGADPVSVRCAHTSSTDTICQQYAMSKR